MPSITGELSNQEYRQVKAFSKSDLDLLHQSIPLLDWARKAPSDGSHAADMGTALHCAVLEPERFDRDYIGKPDFGSSTAEKDAASAWALATSGKIDLVKGDFEKVLAMRSSIFAHPTARYLLSSGEAERSIFWSHEGLKLKCRTDWICDSETIGHVLVDVKKIDRIENRWSAIEEHRYYVQAAFYRDAYLALTGTCPRFVFIFVGERRELGRHPVRVVELDQDWITAGRVEYLADLELAREYQDFGPGQAIETISRPRWAKAR